VDHHVVTDEELAQARRDPAFRKQLIASNLDHLLAALARLRSSEGASSAEPARQLREGAQLAVKLASLLQRAGGNATLP
jgi:hypothetical protein